MICEDNGGSMVPNVSVMGKDGCLSCGLFLEKCQQGPLKKKKKTPQNNHNTKQKLSSASFPF